MHFLILSSSHYKERVRNKADFPIDDQSLNWRNREAHVQDTSCFCSHTRTLTRTDLSPHMRGKSFTAIHQSASRVVGSQ